MFWAPQWRTMKLSKVEATSFFETNKYSQPSEYNYSHKFYFMIKNPLPRFEPPTCSTVQCVPNLNSMIKASMIHSKQSRHPCFKSQYTFKINTLHPNTVRARIPNIRIPNPFEFRTFWRSVFECSDLEWSGPFENRTFEHSIWPL